MRILVTGHTYITDLTRGKLRALAALEPGLEVTVAVPRLYRPGGVQSGVHAADMLDAGATLVGVGTESFRDPAAGTRISRELDDLFAKSGDNLAG